MAKKNTETCQIAVYVVLVVFIAVSKCSYLPTYLILITVTVVSIIILPMP